VATPTADGPARRVPSRGRCQRRRSGPGRLGTAQRESETRRCEQNQTASTVGANVGRWREDFSSLMYKIYAESFLGREHLARIQDEARALVAAVLAR